jgi:hypothetical protein
MQESDLAIIIECEILRCHHWMSFASWYSIQKKLCDVPVYLALSGTNKGLFGWASRCGVRILRNQFNIDRPIIKRMQPTVMAVREFDGNFNIVSSKTDITSTFVDYRFGCGKFIIEEWHNKVDVPFEKALKRFSTYDLNVNELAILNLWEQCYISYRAIGGLN